MQDSFWNDYAKAAPDSWDYGYNDLLEELEDLENALCENQDEMTAEEIEDAQDEIQDCKDRIWHHELICS